MHIQKTHFRYLKIEPKQKHRKLIGTNNGVAFVGSERGFHGLEGLADSGSDELLLLENGLQFLAVVVFDIVVVVVVYHGCEGGRWSSENGKRVGGVE